MNKFKWCFIGTGGLAKKVAAQLNESGRHEIVSCYTRNYQNGLDFAEKFGCTAFDTAEKAITAEGVEGVYVVTPHNAHYRFVKLALSLGKPVLCEKPFTVTAEETDELIKLAREKDVYLCEAMWTWFSEGANQTKKWIDEKKIGDITSAYLTFHEKTIAYLGRHIDAKRAGGVLLDITVYPITYSYRLWGKPSKIEAEAVIEKGIDLRNDFIFTYDDGFEVNIHTSIDGSGSRVEMKIQGSEGTLEADNYHSSNAVTYRNGSVEEVFEGTGPNLNSYVVEFDAVANNIRSGLKESEMVPLKATSDVMHIMDEIRAQIGLCYDELE